MMHSNEIVGYLDIPSLEQAKESMWDWDELLEIFSDPKKRDFIPMTPLLDHIFKKN
jgi:hypothetical protein